MKKDGAPAFPLNQTVTVSPDAAELDFQVSHPGMSKRFYAAVHAMQGIMANTGKYHEPSSIATEAFEIADALIEQEGKE